jgi:FKBP-type peptidyl-prolyl cis-trans isomerase 2
MALVQEGDKVVIVFEAKLETGEIVLKTDDERPLEVVVGTGEIPQLLEKIILNMQGGETKTVTLQPAEAFGPRIDDLVIDLPKEGFGQDAKLDVGCKVSMTSPNGKTFIGIIQGLKENEITVDFNHPLAGKNLVFTVTVVSVEKNCNPPLNKVE